MLSVETRHAIDELLKRYPSKRGALVMAVHAVQRDKKFLTPDDCEELSLIFDIPASEIESTAGFYDMFHCGKTGEYRIGVCTNVSCMLGGSNGLAEHLKKILGVEFGETTPDGLFSLFEQECLGSCDFAPVITINDEQKGNMTTEKVDALIVECRAHGCAMEGR
jgi:NADH-quinone oxidoreductase subunit E